MGHAPSVGDDEGFSPEPSCEIRVQPPLTLSIPGPGHLQALSALRCGQERSEGGDSGREEAKGQPEGTNCPVSLACGLNTQPV